MNLGQEKLKNFMKLNKRIPTFNEAFDLYVEFVMRAKNACRISPYSRKREDLKLWEIENAARLWFRNSLGSLLLQGEFEIFFITIKD